jgi:hypothetical protein
MNLRRVPSLELIYYGMRRTVTDSHTILGRWRKHFSQLLSVNGVNDVRQREIHTAEPLVTKSSASDVEMAIEKLKRHETHGTDQIQAALINSGSRKIRSGIHKLYLE